MTLLSHADYERIAANLSYPTEAFYRRDIRPRPLRRDNADRQPSDRQGNRPGRLLRARRRRQGRRRGAQGF